MIGLRPVLDLWRLFYVSWALREIDPMHPDVPALIVLKRQLEDKR